MIDLAFVRANLELVEEKLRSRGMDPAVARGEFEAVDRERREAITQVETLKAQRNRLTDEIAGVRRSGGDAAGLMEQTKALKVELERLEGGAAMADERLRGMMQTLPNLPAADVPVGPDEHANREVKVWWPPNYLEFMANRHFAAKDHIALGEGLGILDFERAAKVSGSRFVVHFGQGAKLERALANFMLDLHTGKHGYTEVLPPNLVNADSLYGTGQLPKFEQDLFKISTDNFEQDRHHIPVGGEQVFVNGQSGLFQVKSVDGWDVEVEFFDPRNFDRKLRPLPMTVPRGALFYPRNLYLIPTAEVPVTNLYRDEVLDEGQLTTSFCAYTPCYRSEAGSYGKDVRGMIRQHQFQKVELVKFCRPADSAAEHEALTGHAEAVLEALGLPYRRMLLCTGDMGFAAAKTYDLEVWLPGQGLYREISSCSNFGEFQARRANIRYKPAGQKKSEFLHTLNGSGLAIGRTYVAVLENYQQADGTVRVPEVLVPYMGGDTVIGHQSVKGRR